jgi:hypothetical protein
MNSKPRFLFTLIFFSALMVLVSSAVSANPGEPRRPVVTAAGNHSKTSLDPQAPQNLFIEAPEYATNGESFAMAKGDFNGDGIVDIVTANITANLNPNTISVLLGNGDGTFQAPIIVPTGTNPIAVAVGDFNGDGKLDVATADNAPESQCGNNGAVSVLLGNGDGTFQAHVDYCVGFEPNSIAVGDFNKDGSLDLAVTNFGNGTISVLLNKGNGTFQAAANYATGIAGNSIVSADFNNDGNLDLALLDNCGNTLSACISVLLGKGDGTFSAPLNTNASFGNNCDFLYLSASFLAAGDLNHDGNLDVAAINPCLIGEAAIFLGNGTGTFQADGDYTTGEGPVAVTLDDLNGNGNLDLITANEFDGTVSVLLGNVDGTFQPRVDYGSGTISVVTADFNGDGKTDIASGFFGTSGVFVAILLGNGDGTFVARADYPAPPGSTPPVALGDFNGDGVADVVTADGSATNNVNVFLNSGKGTLEPYSQYATGSDPVGVAVGDFNADGKLDIVTANEMGSTISLLLGNGDGTFQPHTDFGTGENPNSIVAADFNGDGKLDVATADFSQGAVSILLGNGDGTFQQSTEYIAGSGPVSLVAADFNGDGKLDLAVANDAGVSILFGNGDGTFQAPVNYSAEYDPTSVATADFNGDGKPDLAVAVSCGDPQCDEGYGGVYILLNNGNGSFQSPVEYMLTAAVPLDAAVGDFNGDGIEDLITADGHLSGDVSVLLGNGDGTFQNPTQYSVGSSPDAVAVGNLTGSGGAADVAVANCACQTGSSTVSILLNTAGTQTTLTSSVNPSDLGQTVTFTATVTGNMQSLGVPGGTVAFLNGDVTLGSETLNGSGITTLTTSTLPAGMDSITAEYLGNSTLGGSTSTPLIQNVIGPSFTLASNPTSLSTSPGGSGSATLTVTPINGFNQAVTFSCSGLPAKTTCSFNPASVTPNGGAVTTTLTIQTPAALDPATYPITVTGSGGGVTSSVGISLIVEGFTLSSSASSLTVAAPGGNAQATLTVTPVQAFSEAVTFSCKGLPTGTTCTFNPLTVTPSGGGVTTTLTIQTTAASLLIGDHHGEPNSPLPLGIILLVGLAAIGGIGLISLRFAPRRNLRWTLYASIVLLMGIGMASCGGGGGSSGGGTSGTPAGTYTVTVIASTGGSNALTQTVPITLVVN